MPTIDGPAGPLHWYQAGDGRPLVLLHGLGGDAGFWGRELAALRHEFRVIALDLRGSGRTPASAGGHRMEDLADDLAAVLDSLDLRTAHVLGFSMGGNVAQTFALEHPERVDKLILASTFATMNPQVRRFLDAVLDVYEHGASDRQLFDLICPWLYSVPFIADPAHRVYLQYPDGEPEQPREAWRNAYLAQRAFDARARLNEVGADTLVIVGEQDRLVTVSDARELADHIPGARLLTLADAGHLLNVEAPEAFLESVREHLSR